MPAPSAQAVIDAYNDVCLANHFLPNQLPLAIMGNLYIGFNFSVDAAALGQAIQNNPEVQSATYVPPNQDEVFSTYMNQSCWYS